MGLKILGEKGYPLEKQSFTWKELVQHPLSKLDDDAYTRVRVILMSSLEQEALRFQHLAARANGALRGDLARVRRVEQHQATLVGWLMPPDQSPLETTLGYEQAAIEITAAVARREPDAYLAQAYRFGLIEDFDHLYRFAALMDRVEGKDPNNILQSYSDIRPGRPAAEEHRHPDDDLRDHYDRSRASPLTKLHALTVAATELQAHDYYMNVGPTLADPVARQLYAEIASLEEQHATQYGSLLDPSDSWLEQWLLHEAMEVYNYHGCATQESDPRIRAIWERMLDYELGHLSRVAELFARHEGRDPAEVLPERLPDPIPHGNQREFVRDVLARELGLRAAGARFVPKEAESAQSRAYRDRMNSDGSPSEIVAAGYRWAPSTELSRKAV